MDDASITQDGRSVITYVIAPSIGIARVGNSPDGYFIGPEYPGQPVRPPGGFKDDAGRVKRQAARFRIYGLDADGKAVKEITASDARITWTVHLANRKGAACNFGGRFKDRDDPLGRDYKGEAPELRNAKPRVPDNDAARWKDPDWREAHLVIDPGPRSVTGADARSTPFDGGRFCGIEVPLGELQTDANGRLLVLGGSGHSGSVWRNNPITDFVNNDGWYDDTSDGIVTARIELDQGTVVEARHAHVIVAPPDFAPDIDSPVTLYDVMAEVALELSSKTQPAKTQPARVSFTRDIYPLLHRMGRLHWVNAEAHRGHGPGTKGDFLSAGALDLLSFLATWPDDPQQAAKLKEAETLRRAILRRMRDPRLPIKQPAEDDAAWRTAQEQARATFMPLLGGDNGDPKPGDPSTYLRILPSQYAALENWAKGAFDADWDGPPRLRTMEDIPLQDRPAALTRAALQACSGGPFYPGIEMTYIAQHPENYEAPFVLRRGRFRPGDITQSMAVPWQADFFECSSHWWPAQRPDDVVPEEAYRQVVDRLANRGAGNGVPFSARALPPNPAPADNAEAAAWARNRLAERVKWDRGIEESYAARMVDVGGNGLPGNNAMVPLWSEMGFVVARQMPAPQDSPDPDKAKDAWSTIDAEIFVETERAPYAGVNLRECYYYLSNIGRYPEFLPKARWLAEFFLTSAWDRQAEEGYPELWRFFPYSEDAFENRMQDIYEALVTDAEGYDPAANTKYPTLDDWKVRLTNFAPLNQNDGAWLRRVTPAGPLDEVQSLLFAIWMDEVGEGRIEKSHANIYTELLRSLGIYLPDPRSRAYAFDERMISSAFAVPVLQLAVSQFSDEYLPELLGMTLQLEWTVPGLYPVQRQSDFVGADSHFFKLHIGIDNAADGHGAMAKRAVKLYLEDIARAGGEAAMQEAWRRVWRGFLAFGDTGTLGDDMTTLMESLHKRTPAHVVEAIIAHKAPFGQRNHHAKELGGTTINALFNNPKEFMKQLRNAGYIVPGRPEDSRFFKLCSFDGPMYKVFNEEELDAWRRWTLWLGTAAAQQEQDDDRLYGTLSRKHLLDAWRYWTLRLPILGGRPGADPGTREAAIAPQAAAPRAGLNARQRMPHTLHNPPPAGAHPSLRVRGMGAIH